MIFDLAALILIEQTDCYDIWEAQGEGWVYRVEYRTCENEGDEPPFCRETPEGCACCAVAGGMYITGEGEDVPRLRYLDGEIIDVHSLAGYDGPELCDFFMREYGTQLCDTCFGVAETCVQPIEIRFITDLRGVGFGCPDSAPAVDEITAQFQADAKLLCNGIVWQSQVQQLTHGQGSVTLALPFDSIDPDLNDDGTVDVLDLVLLLTEWNRPGAGDLDCNGETDVPDLVLMIDFWGEKLP